MASSKFNDRPEDRTGRRPLVEASYTDEDGRMWAVLVPEGDEDKANMGIVVGPPDLAELDLPKEVEIRLHNQLFQRRLLTAQHLRGRGQEIYAALQAAYRVDLARLTSLYR